MVQVGKYSVLTGLQESESSPRLTLLQSRKFSCFPEGSWPSALTSSVLSGFSGAAGFSEIRFWFCSSTALSCFWFCTAVLSRVSLTILERRILSVSARGTRSFSFHRQVLLHHWCLSPGSLGWHRSSFRLHVVQISTATIRMYQDVSGG